MLFASISMFWVEWRKNIIPWLPFGMDSYLKKIRIGSANDGGKGCSGVTGWPADGQIGGACALLIGDSAHVPGTTLAPSHPRSLGVPGQQFANRARRLPRQSRTCFDGNISLMLRLGVFLRVPPACDVEINQLK